MKNYITIAAILISALQPNASGVLNTDIEFPPRQSAPNIRETSVTTTVWVTAYSSTPDQTDSTPFITASGTRVKDGVIAANFLPFGTIIKIPALFGDKIFTVEDRMHPRKKKVVDVWMPSTKKALSFGAHKTKIVLLAVD